MSSVAGPMLVPSPRWVRVKFGGEIVADSKQAILLRQDGRRRLPAYYFPKSDVRMALWVPGSGTKDSSERVYHTLQVADRLAEDSAWEIVKADSATAGLEGYVSFAWRQMDGWYEEEEEIFVHPRDPYHRVDVLESSRHVQVMLNGKLVAETHRPFLLFETGLPTRYYLAQRDVRMDLLEPTNLTTRCPYKGIASYWRVTAGNQDFENIVWGYPDPIPEQPKIRGLVCFFNEKVDLYVDGKLQPRPRSPWS